MNGLSISTKCVGVLCDKNKPWSDWDYDVGSLTGFQKWISWAHRELLSVHCTESYRGSSLGRYLEKVTSFGV